MSSEENKEIVNCTGASEDLTVCKELDDNVKNQALVIGIAVFVVLLIFLGFFVYNLIKCYLPKWRGRGGIEFQQVPKQSDDSSANRGVQIEFESGPN